MIFQTLTLTVLFCWDFISGGAVPNIPSITGSARSSQIARCTDGEILISFSKRMFFNNHTHSREYILQPVCAPFENPNCVKQCKWSPWCKAAGFEDRLTVVGGLGLRNYGPPYGHMLLLYCCELASTVIDKCEMREESELALSSDPGLFAEMNIRGGLTGHSVIRDVYSRKVNGEIALRIEMCAVNRVDPNCLTQQPVPAVEPFNLMMTPSPQEVKLFFSGPSLEPDWRIRQPTTTAILGFEPDSVDKLIQSYLQKTCPVEAKDALLGCAASFVDHSTCCSGFGLNKFRRGLCMVFCNPTRGLPKLGVKYLPCLNKISQIATCFKQHIQRQRA